MNYKRKSKEDKPVVAICYDFDKTLSPDDMQAQGYIQSVGYDVAEFWNQSNKIATENEMDSNLAYMYLMCKEAEGKFNLTREKLQEYGSKVSLFKGVKDWFRRVDEYGKRKNVIVEHYVISSGLKEMIEGTEIYKQGAFQKVYASAFYYDENGNAIWPAQVVNFTNKTQYLFRISKGTVEINDPGVNEVFAREDIRVPFTNMIYVGDSATDIPFMKLVCSYGGLSIGVYNENTGDKRAVEKILCENRINHACPANYEKDSELEKIVFNVIDKVAKTI